MATELKKTIEREVAAGWCRRGLFGMGGNANSRALIVSLEPGPTVTFRLKGQRKRYTIDLETVFNMAVKSTAKSDMAEAKKDAEMRRIIRGA